MEKIVSNVLTQQTIYHEVGYATVEIKQDEVARYPIQEAAEVKSEASVLPINSLYYSTVISDLEIKNAQDQKQIPVIDSRNLIFIAKLARQNQQQLVDMIYVFSCVFHENKKSATADQKEVAIPSLTLTDQQYKIFEWVVENKLDELQKFIRSNSKFDFNYVDDFFAISPLMLALLLERKDITKKLIAQGARVIPANYVSASMSYMGAGLLLLSDHHYPAFTNILAEHIDLTKLHHSRFPELPFIFEIAMRGISDNFPCIELLTRLFNRGCRAEELVDPQNPDSSFIATILGSDENNLGVNSAQVIQVLLERGVDRQYFIDPAKQEKGVECLMFAAQFSVHFLEPFFSVYPEFCQQNINQLIRGGYLITSAAAGRSADAVRFLLQKGASLELQESESGDNAMHYLCAYARNRRTGGGIFESNLTLGPLYPRYLEFINLVRILLRNATTRASLEQRNKKGQTAFLKAAEYAAYDVLQCFDPSRQHEIRQVDAANNTALHLLINAISQITIDRWAALQVLLNFEYVDVNAKNKKGDTAVHLVLEKLKEDSSYWLDFAKTLLSFPRTDIHIANNAGLSILQAILNLKPQLQDELLVCVLARFPNLIHTIVKAKVSYNTTTYPLLHHAIAYQLSAVTAHIVVMPDCMINQVDQNGYPPLLMLCGLDKQYGVQEHATPLEAINYFSDVPDLPPLTDTQFNIVKQMLARPELEVMRTRQIPVEAKEVSAVPAEQLNALRFAVCRKDLRLFRALLHHRSVKFEVYGDNTLLLDIIQHYKFYKNSAHSDKENSMAVFRSMLLELLARSDIFTFPSVKSQTKDISDLEDLIVCNDSLMLRHVLCHPATMLSALLCRAELNIPDEQKECATVWRAGNVLSDLSLALLRKDGAAMKRNLLQLRQLDEAMLDLFMLQVLMPKFQPYYRLDNQQIALLLQNSTLFQTKSFDLLMSLAEQYETGRVVQRDLLLAEGLYLRAATIDSDKVANKLARYVSPAEDKQEAMDLAGAIKNLTGFAERISITPWRQDPTKVVAKDVATYLQTALDQQIAAAEIRKRLVIWYSYIKFQSSDPTVLNILQQLITPRQLTESAVARRGMSNSRAGSVT